MSLFHGASQRDQLIPEIKVDVIRLVSKIKDKINDLPYIPFMHTKNRERSGNCFKLRTAVKGNQTSGTRAKCGIPFLIFLNKDMLNITRVFLQAIIPLRA